MCFIIVIFAIIYAIFNCAFYFKLTFLKRYTEFKMYDYNQKHYKPYIFSLYLEVEVKVNSKIHFQCIAD